MKYIFFLTIYMSIVYAGKYYEVDTYGNIRTSGTLTVGGKITAPEIDVSTANFKFFTTKDLITKNLFTETINSTTDTIKILKSIDATSITFFGNLIYGSLVEAGTMRTSNLYVDDIFSRTLNKVRINRDLDLTSKEIKSFRVDNVISVPATGLEGQMIYYQGKIYWWDGTTWRTTATNENYFDIYIKKLYPEFGLQHGTPESARAWSIWRVDDDGWGIPRVTFSAYRNPSWFSSKTKFRFLTDGDFEFTSSSNTSIMTINCSKVDIDGDVYLGTNKKITSPYADITSLRASGIRTDQLNTWYGSVIESISPFRTTQWIEANNITATNKMFANEFQGNLSGSWINVSSGVVNTNFLVNGEITSLTSIFSKSIAYPNYYSILGFKSLRGYNAGSYTEISIADNNYPNQIRMSASNGVFVGDRNLYKLIRSSANVEQPTEYFMRGSVSINANSSYTVTLSGVSQIINVQITPYGQSYINQNEVAVTSVGTNSFTIQNGEAHSVNVFWLAIVR